MYSRDPLVRSTAWSFNAARTPTSRSYGRNTSQWVTGCSGGESRGSYQNPPAGGIGASCPEGRRGVGEDVEGLRVHWIRGVVPPVRGTRGDGVFAGAGRRGGPRGLGRFPARCVLVVEVDRGASRRGVAELPLRRVRPDRARPPGAGADAVLGDGHGAAG